MKVSALKKVFEKQTAEPQQNALVVPTRSHRRSVSTSFIAQETLEEHIQLVKTPRDILQFVGDHTVQRGIDKIEDVQPTIEHEIVSTNNETKNRVLELE